jgi:hypothetical protein
MPVGGGGRAVRAISCSVRLCGSHALPFLCVARLCMCILHLQRHYCYGAGDEAPFRDDDGVIVQRSIRVVEDADQVVAHAWV